MATNDQDRNEEMKRERGTDAIVAHSSCENVLDLVLLIE